MLNVLKKIREAVGVWLRKTHKEKNAVPGALPKSTGRVVLSWELKRTGERIKWPHYTDEREGNILEGFMAVPLVPGDEVLEIMSSGKVCRFRAKSVTRGVDGAPEEFNARVVRIGYI